MCNRIKYSFILCIAALECLFKFDYLGFKLCMELSKRTLLGDCMEIKDEKSKNTKV